ncbi:MAG TPA: C2 family cysteine protease [Fimbriimonadaceae bacterium]|nr:C2 family cysteine protease [Fimbriimonadaceae bacterium]
MRLRQIVVLQVFTFLFLAQAQAAAPTFSQTVLNDFTAWDTNHDGQLTQNEVDAAALDSKFHGPDAAALAALHRWMSLTKDPLPPLTREWFQSYQPVRLRIVKGTPAAEAKTERKAYAATPGSLQSSYAGSLRRLEHMQATSLFGSEGPALSDIRQGALGDCYFLAPLGAVVNRSPDDVRKMIQPDGSGYQVRFPDGQQVRVRALTDAELAMVGSATQQGVWTRVMEIAYGSRKIADGEIKIATDTMNGGSTATAGKALTGHRFRSVKLVGDFKKDVPSASLQETMGRLRTDIPQAVSTKLLVLAGTPKLAMPKSISPNHAYAVLGFDPATDKITLWNPHGNDFKPKGDEGPDNGYRIENGVFSMPLEMFVRTFGHILFERADVP